MDIVRFKGGLGNQMFQYAFYRALRYQGRDARANLEFYRRNPKMTQFCLPDVFPKIDLKQVPDEIYKAIETDWEKMKLNPERLAAFLKDYENRFFWVEESLKYQPQVFATRNCTFVGYWQSEKYFKHMKDTLQNEFQFPYGEEKLDVLKKKFLGGAYVAVHIRRGDYLKNSDVWGNLGESRYYLNAFRYIEEKTKSVRFVYFSDDIQWVKQNYKQEGAIYIEESMFDDYEPWYDLCLMTCCTHNIIANSTFSWWGAWLNKNKAKIVITPDTWFFDGEGFEDIIPEEWIKVKVS